METNVSDERVRFVGDCESGQWSMTELCERYCVSRPTGCGVNYCCRSADLIVAAQPTASAVSARRQPSHEAVYEPTRQAGRPRGERSLNSWRGRSDISNIQPQADSGSDYAANPAGRSSGTGCSADEAWLKAAGRFVASPTS